MAPKHFDWYSALIVQQSEHPDEKTGERLYEIDTIIFKARSGEEAREKAAVLGRSLGGEYLNGFGNRVVWTMKEVLDVRIIQSRRVSEGTGVHSFFVNLAELDQLRTMFTSK